MKSCSAGGSGKNKMKMMRMRGFMCQSGAVDLMVCRSSSAVIVPRKKNLSSSSGSYGQSSDSLSATCSAGKYMILVESPSLNISESNQKTSSTRCLREQPRSMASIRSASDSEKDDVFQVSASARGCTEPN